jgi:hypothetical protein
MTEKSSALCGRFAFFPSNWDELIGVVTVTVSKRDTEEKDDSY